MAVVNVVPGDLALDPEFHPGRGSLDLGVEVRILPVPARKKK